MGAYRETGWIASGSGVVDASGGGSLLWGMFVRLVGGSDLDASLSRAQA